MAPTPRHAPLSHAPRSHAPRISGRPAELHRAASMRRASLARIEARVTALADAGRSAALRCEGLAVDHGLPGRVLAVVRLAWELDHGIDVAADALSSADRQRALDFVDARRRPGLDAERAALADRYRASVLRYDDRGDGRLVLAWGDLVDADHVLVLVPGMGNQLGNVDGMMARADRLLAEMRRLAGPGVKVAVVGWLGYNSPDADLTGLADGARGAAARDGADALNRDVALVRRLAPPAAHVTVVGHSYGTRLVAEAMRVPTVGLDVPDVVLAGSPGTGVDHRDGLGHAGTRVWTAAIGPDWVRPVPVVHGPDPHDGGWGGRRLPTDGVRGHSGYFEQGTASLVAIAAVAVGRRDPAATAAEERARRRASRSARPGRGAPPTGTTAPSGRR